MKPRWAVLGSLVSAVALAQSAGAPAVVFSPVADAKVPAGLALAIQERASALVSAVPSHGVVHARQVASMAERHRVKLDGLSDSNAARKAAERLGAGLFVASSLKPGPGGYQLEWFASKVGGVAFAEGKAALPAGAALAVQRGSDALAEGLLRFDGVKAPLPSRAQPQSANDAAVVDYAACADVLMAQPLGIENPSVLREAELAAAIRKCEAAVKADPTFAAGWAALALAAAIHGDDAQAVEALGRAKDEGGSLPNRTLARFWLVSRYQSSEAAEQVLAEAVRAEPGAMLMRAYLGELYNTLGRHADAARVWRAYAADCPSSPFALSRLAYTLARLGQADEAAAFAEKALAFDPASPDLKLELASRYLDAGKADQAVATLEPELDKHPSAELWLRYGYAQLRRNELGKAQEALTAAFAAAQAGTDWRTRSRAKLNLAELAFRQGKKDMAKQLLSDSVREGLVARPTPETKELLALLSPAELKALAAKGVGLRKESSPFVVEAGEVAPAAARPQAPAGFDAVKVKVR